MAVQASKSVSLTDVATGKPFELSAANIINFLASGANTLITYVSNRDTVISRLVTQGVAAINGATGGRTQAVTQSTGVIYINSDRIIFLDDITTSRMIIYDAGVNIPAKLFVSEVIAVIDIAAGNTFTITTQPTTEQASVSRWINNLLINQILPDNIVKLPTLAATYKIKIEVLTPTAGGAAYVDAAATFSGGGVGAVLPTATVAFALGAVTGMTIVTAGSNITADVLVTITSASGAGATFVNKINHILDTLIVTDGGENVSAYPTVTFGAGTVTATAYVTLDTFAQKVSSVTISNVGAYLASAFPPTITLSGGSGATIHYNSKGTGFDNIQVLQTSAALKITINAL